MIIKAPISLGELYDKIAILQIKLIYIKEDKAFTNISYELNRLTKLIPVKKGLEEFADLFQVNHDLWEIEDAIRKCEKEGDFGQKFIDLARSVYVLNDRRAYIKRVINEKYKSTIKEEKLYESY